MGCQQSSIAWASHISHLFYKSIRLIKFTTLPCEVMMNYFILFLNIELMEMGEVFKKVDA
jgi:hypothetical protein